MNVKESIGVYNTRRNFWYANFSFDREENFVALEVLILLFERGVLVTTEF